MQSKSQKFYKLDQLVSSRCTADGRKEQVHIKLKKEVLKSWKIGPVSRLLYGSEARIGFFREVITDSSELCQDPEGRTNRETETSQKN
jgi:hypothetical protein